MADSLIEQALRLKEEEAKVKEKHRRIMRTEIELLVGSVFFVAIVFFIGFGLGAIALTIPSESNNCSTSAASGSFTL